MKIRTYKVEKFRSTNIYIRRIGLMKWEYLLPKNNEIYTNAYTFTPNIKGILKALTEIFKAGKGNKCKGFDIYSNNDIINIENILLKVSTNVVDIQSQMIK